MVDEGRRSSSRHLVIESGNIVTHNERRMARRSKPSGRKSVQIVQAGKAFFGTLNDVSAHGFSIIGKFDLPQHSMVHATIQLGIVAGEKLGLVALVAYVVNSVPVDGGHRYGFELAFIGDDEYSRLMRALDAMAAAETCEPIGEAELQEAT